MNLYTNLADVCCSFYEQFFPHEIITKKIEHYLEANNAKKIVFFGALVEVAEQLVQAGYDMTFAEYTDELFARAQEKVHANKFIQTDMRELQVEQHDAIILMGRIFTYMYTDADAKKALRAFYNALKPDGILIVDHYETGKLDKDNYFNGSVEAGSVTRISTMKHVQEAPALYEWDCTYVENGKEYHDNGHILRACTREEVTKLLNETGFELVEHIDNFEPRSFVTIAKKR
ncbi:MAG: class I SAM-dependent methyltransferase [Candidatus Woesearchaeota archaeon]|nr:class I SAM-dependent methyltransferase [Candidatus Woesearchaeota archaeon]